MVVIFEVIARHEIPAKFLIVEVIAQIFGHALKHSRLLGVVVGEVFRIVECSGVGFFGL